MSAVEQAVELVAQVQVEHDLSWGLQQPDRSQIAYCNKLGCGWQMRQTMLMDDDHVREQHAAHVAAEIVKALGLEEERERCRKRGCAVCVPQVRLVTRWRREVTP